MLPLNYVGQPTECTQRKSSTRNKQLTVDLGYYVYSYLQAVQFSVWAVVFFLISLFHSSRKETSVHR